MAYRPYTIILYITNASDEHLCYCFSYQERSPFVHQGINTQKEIMYRAYIGTLSRHKENISPCVMQMELYPK